VNHALTKSARLEKALFEEGAWVVEETKIKTNRATEFSKDLVTFLNERPRFNGMHSYLFNALCIATQDHL
jgi:hypothetical protein